MYSLRLYLGNHQQFCLSLLVLPVVLLISSSAPSSAKDEAVYGPENLFKTLSNPFNTRPAHSAERSSAEADALAPLAINREPRSLQIRSLKERFNAPKLFLPERIAIGKTSEFLIKAQPGMYAAIAMADKSSGAKPIFGHTLRLGPDRKVMAVGKVPDNGILSLYVEAPIQGDLIGDCLYFEAAIWSKPDFSDLQIATPISPQQTEKESNAVVIAGDSEQKKRGFFVFDQSKPSAARELPGSLSTSRP
jgi:hypothetical protein